MEQQRIEFLIQRDGPKAACTWVTRTLEMYRQAIATPHSHAAMPHYRPLFEQSISEFELWLTLCDISLPDDSTFTLPQQLVQS